MKTLYHQLTFAYAGLAIVAACSGPPAVTGPPPEYEPPSDTAPHPSLPAPGKAAVDDDDQTAQLEPSPPSANPAPTNIASPKDPQPQGPSSCPEGMVLVEGDYCTKVKQQCMIEWYAPQNNKRVCEQFEPRTECIGKIEKRRFCIDKYAWPNKKGVRPEVMTHFYQMQVKCAAAGKRMCTESEWTMACEGPEMKPFPHGYVRDPKKCNGDHKWDNPNMTLVGKRNATELARLWRGVPSGSQPECVSDYGVHDLPGNNDEFVTGDTPKARYNSVNTGGPWYSGVRNQCRPKVYTHEEGFYYYFLGFRCCGEPDGGATDPRSPKQIRENWKFSSSERLARFTTEQMKQVLALQEKGECNCGAGNSLPGVDSPLKKSPRHLCKTMCGTLLGPGLKDGDDSTRVPHKKRRKIKK